MVSILGLIFVKDPFFNEPGYNGQEERYKKQSEDYNRDIRFYTLKYAILNNLRNLNNLEYFPKSFRSIIKLHFIKKYSLITKKVKEWIKLEIDNSRKQQMSEYLNQINTHYQ